LALTDNIRFVGPLERALFLKSLEPMFEHETSTIAAFALNARERSFAAGERVFTAGERTRSFHVVVEGSLRAQGPEYPDGFSVGERRSVGFLSLLSGHPKGLDAVAETDVVSLQFEDHVLFELLEDHFSLLHGLIRQLARRTLEFRRNTPSGTYLAPMDGEIRYTGRPLDLVERLRLIRGPGSPFGSGSLEALARLANSSDEVHFDANETLWQTGDRADSMFMILDGTVACTTPGGASRFRVGPGFPLGNLERFSGEPRWFSAVTETPVVALRNDTESLFDVLEDHFDTALVFVSAMARRVIDIRQEFRTPTLVVSESA
jgi:CRP-like cAMP-binding protein